MCLQRLAIYCSYIDSLQQSEIILTSAPVLIDHGLFGIGPSLGR